MGREKVANISISLKYEAMADDAKALVGQDAPSSTSTVSQKLVFCDEMEKRLSRQSVLTVEIFRDLWRTCVHIGIFDPVFMARRAEALNIPLEEVSSWVEPCTEYKNHWVHKRYRIFLKDTIRQLRYELVQFKVQ